VPEVNAGFEQFFHTDCGQWFLLKQDFSLRTWTHTVLSEICMRVGTEG
jgi:hypothetical protein